MFILSITPATVGAAVWTVTNRSITSLQGGGAMTLFSTGNLSVPISAAVTLAAPAGVINAGTLSTQWPAGGSGAIQITDGATTVNFATQDASGFCMRSMYAYSTTYPRLNNTSATAVINYNWMGTAIA